MKFDILTIFPAIFDSYINESIIKRARDEGHININSHDIREYATDKHRSVDDTPYGGGVGMVMKIEPLYKSLQSIKREKKSRVVLLSPGGNKWNQQRAQEYAKLDQVIFICGRYEGVDHRITEFIDEEISVGDYVLTGGELPALVMVDSIARLLPGVLGSDESSEVESHSEEGYLEYPHYTRPQDFKVGDVTYSVPDVLLSGDHKKIEEWKQEQSKRSK